MYEYDVRIGAGLDAAFAANRDFDRLREAERKEQEVNNELLGPDGELPESELEREQILSARTRRERAEFDFMVIDGVVDKLIGRTAIDMEVIFPEYLEEQKTKYGIKKTD